MSAGRHALAEIDHANVKCSIRINIVNNGILLNVVLHTGFADKILNNPQATCTIMQ